jgi:putative ABC transport system permease protein
VKASFYFHYAAWEIRGRPIRLAYFVACLAIGVAAVVVVSGLSRGFEAGVRGEAKQLLSADLALRSSQPLDEQLVSAVNDLPGSRSMRTRELVTMVRAESGDGRPGPTRLVELKVVAAEYPFYGELGLRPRAELGTLLDERSAVVAPQLLAQLGIDLGDSLNLGGQLFHISGLVESEPDRIMGSLTLGPRVFISAEGLERAELLSLGSRVEYGLLVKMPAATTIQELRRIKIDLARLALPPARVRIETYDEAQPSIRRALYRVESYLGLLALLSLLIGGIGVGQAIRTWIATRMDAIAVLKCLGLRPHETLLLFFGQAMALGLLGSLAGCLFGVGLETLILNATRGILPTHLIDPWQIGPLLRGFFLGLGVTAVFGLSPLLQVLRVPPARVFRRNAEPLPGSRWAPAAAALTLIVAISGMATLQSSSPILGLQFTGIVVLTTAVLVVVALALTRLSRRLPRELGAVWLRHGLASIGRPGIARLYSIVALGLGVLVIFATTQVQSNLTAQLEAELPTDAPSAFMIDVQTDQWPPLRRLLADRGGEQLSSVAVITARIRAINGVGVEELTKGAQRGGRRWALRREQRLTYMDELPAGNRLIAGELWKDPERPELSVEAEFAADLGLQLGAVIEFDIQGAPLELTVTSLRTVEWETMGINFFLVAEPGSLDEAPQFRLATARLPTAEEQEIQNAVVADFPNVTIVLIRELIERIVRLMTQLGWGVRFLGAFTALAGLAILAGSIAVESRRRGQEVALLKTLGMKRAGVVTLFATEYALLGLAAGVIGAAGGGFVSWVVMTKGMELTWSFRLTDYFVAAVASALLAVVAGILASTPALRRRPSEVLRAL